MKDQSVEVGHKSKRAWVTPEAKIVVGSPSDIQNDVVINPGMDGITFEGS